jgi:hypothetical protein
MAAESNSDESISSTTLDAAPESKTEPSAIPNGGFAAWLQVLGAHLLFFNSWQVLCPCLMREYAWIVNNSVSGVLSTRLAPIKHITRASFFDTILHPRSHGLAPSKDVF